MCLSVCLSYHIYFEILDFSIYFKGREILLLLSKGKDHFRRSHHFRVVWHFVLRPFPAAITYILDLDLVNACAL